MNKPTIAAFDFDGTITTRDSLLPFLVFTFGAWTTAGKLACLIPTFIAYLFGLSSRQTTKEAVLNRFFGKTSIQMIELHGIAFSRSSSLKALMRPEALKRIAWHKERGDVCVLVSASVDAYLVPWGELMGFDHVICSRLGYDDEGKFTGRLEGENCRSGEKVRRLLELCGPRDNFVLYAYGDSAGDAELLAAADFPFQQSTCYGIIALSK